MVEESSQFKYCSRASAVINDAGALLAVEDCPVLPCDGQRLDDPLGLGQEDRVRRPMRKTTDRAGQEQV